MFVRAASGDGFKKDLGKCDRRDAGLSLFDMLTRVDELSPCCIFPRQKIFLEALEKAFLRAWNTEKGARRVPFRSLPRPTEHRQCA